MMILRRTLGVLLGGLTASCGPSASSHDVEVGTWDDIQLYVQRLAAADGYAVLVIEVVGSGEFIQFSADSGLVQMDFPLVTPDQQAREDRIRDFFAARNLTLVENTGTDGSRFLDCELRAGPEAIASLTREAFIEVFQVREEVRLRFVSQNLAAAP